MATGKTQAEWQREVDELRLRLDEAEETLRAIRSGEVDALVVAGESGDQVFTLHDAERPYRVLVEAMQEGAVTLSETGLILYCNPRFAEMLHMPSEKVLGASMDQFVIAESRATFESLLVQSQYGIRRAELRLVCGDGSTVPVVAAFSPLWLDRLSAVCLVVTDLSVQKQREQEILHLQKELEGRVIERTAELSRANQQLQREIEERTRVAEQLARLQAVTTALSAALTSAEVASAIMRLGVAAVDALSGGVFLLTEDGKYLKLAAAAGYPAPLVDFWRSMPMHLTPVTFRHCAAAREPVWFEPRDSFLEDTPFTLAHSVDEVWVALPLVIHQQMIGLLTLGFGAAENWDDERRRFVLSLSEQSAQALHRALLYERVQMTATIEERQRLARDLHDAVSQTLFSASVMAEALPRVAQRDPQRALQQLPEVSRLTRGALAEMRALLLELRPSTLIASKLSDLLVQLANAVQVKRRITIQVAVQETDPLPPEVHIGLYRIAQEALNNIVKHSRATEARIGLRADGERLLLEVVDNGTGFDTSSPKTGMGLGMMRERAEGIGAVLRVASAPRQGTHITVIYDNGAHAARSSNSVLVTTSPPAVQE